MRFACLSHLLIAILWAFATPTCAASEAQSLAITLYPHDSSTSASVVFQKRMELPEGQSRIHFDVPGTIDPDTVVVSGEGVTLLDATVRLPPATPEQTLRAYLGHEILINRKQDRLPDRARQPETLRGTLLSFDDRSLVMTTDNRQIPLQIIPRNDDIMEIKFLQHDAAPPTKPTLTCAIEATPSSAPRTVELRYRATGISGALTPSQSSQLPRFATVRNQTDFAFVDARLTFALDSGTDRPVQTDRPITLPSRSTQRIAVPPVESNRSR